MIEGTARILNMKQILYYPFLDRGSLFFLRKQTAFYAAANILRLLGDKCY